MEFDRNKRPQYGRYRTDESGGNNRDGGGYRGGNNRGGGGGYRGGNNRGGGGGYRDRNDSYEPRQRDEAVYSEKVRAGKRRTYFFDVRQTRGEDYFITVTESTKRSDGYGHTRHKIFLYKEDFNRFAGALESVINKIKTELMPDFDYEEFDRRQAEWEATNLDEDGNYIGNDDNSSDSSDDEVVKVVKVAAKVDPEIAAAMEENDAEDDGNSEETDDEDKEIKGEDDMEW